MNKLQPFVANMHMTITDQISSCLHSEIACLDFHLCRDCFAQSDQDILLLCHISITCLYPSIAIVCLGNLVGDHLHKNGKIRAMLSVEFALVNKQDWELLSSEILHNKPAQSGPETRKHQQTRSMLLFWYTDFASLRHHQNPNAESCTLKLRKCAMPGNITKSKTLRTSFPSQSQSRKPQLNAERFCDWVIGIDANTVQMANYLALLLHQRVIKSSSYEPLGSIDCVARVCDGLSFGWKPYKPLTLICKCHHRRGRPCTLCILYHLCSLHYE